MHQDAASAGPGTPAPAGTGWGAPSPPSHSHATCVCVVSIVQTPPFKNGAYAGSRATLQKNSPLRLRGSRWKARLKMGCFLVCPHGAFLSLGALFSRILGKERCVQREFKPKEHHILILTGLNISAMVTVSPVLGVSMFLKTDVKPC